MSDVVKIVFDGDLGPLQQKQALAKTELNTFATESEAKIKGITGVGDAIGTASAKGAQDFSRYYKPVINDISTQLKSLSGGFEKVLGAEASKGAVAGVENIQLSLKKLTLEGYEASASSEIFESRLRGIQKELARYQLQLAAAAQENIFFAETEVAAAEASKTVNFGAQPLRGYGGIFRATGATNAGINEVEANAALGIISKLGISVSALATVGGVAALGAAAVAVSSKINSEAESRLLSEENIAISINKQVIGLRDAVAEYDKIKDRLNQQQVLSGKIADLVNSNDSAGIKALRDKTDQDNLAKISEINRLQANLATQERLLDSTKSRSTGGAISTLFGNAYSPTQQRADVASGETAIERTKKQLAEAENQLKEGESQLRNLDGSLKTITQNQDKAFDNKFKEFQAAQEQKQKFQLELNARFAASVKEANQEVIRLGKGFKDEFSQLFLATEGDNPFARQMIQNSKSVDALKERLKGANPELLKTALGLNEAANASAIYTTRLNTQLQAIDLRTQAQRFLEPTQREKQLAFQDNRAEQARTSNSTNPDVIAQNILDAVKAGAINKDQAFQSFLDTTQTRNREQIRGFRNQIEGTFTDTQRRQQSVLDQKLGLADRARTPEEKAIADKTVAAFASGLNPEDLTRSERARIAESLERSAIRAEKREEEALQLQKDLLAVNKSIAEHQASLLKVAASGGKVALDLIVRDDTGSGATVTKTPKAPTPNDTQELYSPSLLTGGSGGLSNI